jgi:hypothetical protein
MTQQPLMRGAVRRRLASGLGNACQVPRELGAAHLIVCRVRRLTMQDAGEACQLLTTWHLLDYLVCAIPTAG